MIVIGSKALLFRLEQTEEVKERYEKSDYDVIMSPNQFDIWVDLFKEHIVKLYPTNSNKYKAILEREGKRKQYEIEIGFEGTSAGLLIKHQDIVTDHAVLGFALEPFMALRLSYQLATKRSHIIYPVHFEKNINDYHLLKKLNYKEVVTGGLRYFSVLDKYAKLRAEESKIKFSKPKTIKLDVSNEDFFKGNVTRYFVHDDIHKIMAHNDRPAYEMMKSEDKMDQAWCEKDLFFDLPYDTQIQCVQEEAYVIALERFIIPQLGDIWMDHFTCYKKALQRICTTLTSGWFREFAFENYDQAIARYNPEFVDILRLAYKEGRINLIEGKTPSDIQNISQELLNQLKELEDQTEELT